MEDNRNEYYGVLEYDSYAEERLGFFEFEEYEDSTWYFQEELYWGDNRETAKAVFDDAVARNRGYYELIQTHRSALETVFYKTVRLIVFPEDPELHENTGDPYDDFWWDDNAEVSHIVSSLPFRVKAAMEEAARRLRFTECGCRGREYDDLEDLVDNGEEVKAESVQYWIDYYSFLD